MYQYVEQQLVNIPLLLLLYIKVSKAVCGSKSPPGLGIFSEYLLSYLLQGFLQVPSEIIVVICLVYTLSY